MRAVAFEKVQNDDHAEVPCLGREGVGDWTRNALRQCLETNLGMRLWVETLKRQLGETDQLGAFSCRRFEGRKSPGEVGLTIVGGGLLDKGNSHRISQSAREDLSPRGSLARVPHMDHPALRIAVVTEVFFDDTDGERLANRLVEARTAGAELVVLPELPMDPWIPASREPDPSDAENQRGRRHQLQSEAARRAGVAVLGGAIIRDSAGGRRHNTALLFDDHGALKASYRKVHLPFEEGFWEGAHYEPGEDPPDVVTGFSLPVGIQICSDANRCSGSQLLAAQGAAVVFVPRATPASSWDRWRLVLRANAVTCATWVVTVNRPSGEEGTDIGGPSAVFGPDGSVVSETTDRIAMVDLDGTVVEQARKEYPGYLAFHPEVHAEGWRRIKRG